MANDTNTGGSDTFTIASKNLPTHTHSVGAHSHGLNSHKHSVGAHAHGLNSHTHTYDKPNGTGGTKLTAKQLPKVSGSMFMRNSGNNSELVSSTMGNFSKESITNDS